MSAEVILSKYVRNVLNTWYDQMYYSLYNM